MSEILFPHCIGNTTEVSICILGRRIVVLETGLNYKNFPHSISRASTGNYLKHTNKIPQNIITNTYSETRPQDSRISKLARLFQMVFIVLFRIFKDFVPNDLQYCRLLSEFVVFPDLADWFRNLSVLYSPGKWIVLAMNYNMIFNGSDLLLRQSMRRDSTYDSARI